ncbi:hypothetical protein ADUPG1_013696 [Aduncisulcus paluster]|uniref:EamA domain-containing protein n=1 Tax=Aduncisulcus paluster TaxID=2918883 RepID=A0ABQ5K3S6_9EUKA|nr:hypothetical protein ADUPG1_013696 [Aduncisulcus paluster]
MESNKSVFGIIRSEHSIGIGQTKPVENNSFDEKKGQLPPIVIPNVPDAPLKFNGSSSLAIIVERSCSEPSSDSLSNSLVLSKDLDSSEDVQKDKDSSHAESLPVLKIPKSSDLLPPIAPLASSLAISKVIDDKISPSSRRIGSRRHKITYLGRIPSFSSVDELSTTMVVSSEHSSSEINGSAFATYPKPSIHHSPLSKSKTQSMSKVDGSECTSLHSSAPSAIIDSSKVWSDDSGSMNPSFISAIIAYVALFLAQLLGAGVAVISNAMTGKIHMVTMLFWRDLFGFIANIPLYLLRPRQKGTEVVDPESGVKRIEGAEPRIRLPPGPTVPHLILLSVSALVVMLSFLVAASETSVTMSGIVNAVSPVITAAMAIVLGYEKGSFLVFISVVVGVLGSVVSLGEMFFASGSSSSSTSTIGLISLAVYIVSCVIYFLYSPGIYSKAKIHAFEVMFWVYGGGTLISAVLVMLFCRDTFITQCKSFGLNEWLMLVGMGALGTTGLWGAQAYACDILRSPTVVHAFSMLSVIINMLSAAVLLGESPSLWEMCGGALVMLGVVFLITGKKRIKEDEDCNNNCPTDEHVEQVSEITGEKTATSIVMIGCLPIASSHTDLVNL